MTREDALKLEADFGVTFPPTYRDAVTDRYPFSDAIEELDTVAESLRKL